MKNHVLRPLWVVLIGIALFLVVRHFIVPADFGVEEGGNFTYNFHRLSATDEWRDFKVKYRGREYCQECHEENVESVLQSPHAIIQCENCHGPAIDHPDNPGNRYQQGAVPQVSYLFTLPYQPAFRASRHRPG